MSDRAAKDFVKKEPQPCPTHRVLPRNSVQTFREFLTYGDTRTHLITILKDMGARSTGPWREYLEFYRANSSGDMASMKPEVRKFAEKIMKSAEKEYERRMIGEEDATEKGKQ